MERSELDALSAVLDSIKAQQELNKVMQKELDSLNTAVMQLADLVGKLASVVR